MRTRKLWPAPILVAVAFAAVLAGVGVAMIPPERADDLVVHEWGTFLAMSGSDGVTLDGMYHEEHALPGFVHARSRDQLRMPSVLVKGETPVIYFYTDRPLQVHVDVRFPRGVWTQWYPQASRVGPGFPGSGSPESLQDGHISWDAAVDPDPRLQALVPPSPEGSLSRYARDVDAATVKTEDSTGAGTRSEY